MNFVIFMILVNFLIFVNLVNLLNFVVLVIWVNFDGVANFDTLFENYSKCRI